MCMCIYFCEYECLYLMQSSYVPYTTCTGIVCSDADVDMAVDQCLIGSTAYNGQRCTAIKLIFLSDTIASPFLHKLVEKVEGLVAGLPWESGVQITPLPEPKKISFLSDLVSDAVSKGARVLNERGGQVYGNIFYPTLVYPVTPNMRLYHEEQFGPVIPIASFTGPGEIHTYLSSSKYGQQAAIFTSSTETLGYYIDLLSHVVGRINVNTQCGRSPDTLPFSGRRSSAMGTLSVTEALRVFSVETVVA
ncbi:aldehyde dehydrogenase family protein, partial [archaeon]